MKRRRRAAVDVVVVIDDGGRGSNRRGNLVPAMSGSRRWSTILDVLY